MIAVIDPALLLTQMGEDLLSNEQEQALTDLVDAAARICMTPHTVIPAVDWYWGKLQREIVRPLHRRIRTPRLRKGLDDLRAYAKPMTLPETPVIGTTRMWGVKALFRDWNGLPPEWLDVMEKLLIGCAQCGDDTVLITRLFPQRNVLRHAVGRCILIEKTRWRLYVHVPGQPPRHIPCVRNRRNLTTPWTARFDDKLPDVGRFPFCPPSQWWRRRTPACRTVQSKPAWVDRFGNGWAKPAAGGDLHWDVFIEDVGLREAVGLNAINVVAWGNREKGKTPGELHHVPAKKQQNLRDEARWFCPDGD